MVERLRDRAADRLAQVMGSWAFVLTQATFLAVWFAWNGLRFSGAWDLYPFILANLVMSAQAAFATPILLMSSNRAAAADRRALHEDVQLDRDALTLLKEIKEKLDAASKPQ